MALHPALIVTLAEGIRRVFGAASSAFGSILKTSRTSRRQSPFGPDDGRTSRSLRQKLRRNEPLLGDADMNTETNLPHRSGLKSAALTAALIALCTTAPIKVMADTQPGPAPETLAAKVSLADVDLSTPEGQRVAYERLRQTARRLCSSLEVLHPQSLGITRLTLGASMRRWRALCGKSMDRRSPPITSCDNLNRH